MSDAYDVVRKFECKVAEFAGSKYAVSVDSCTNAIFLSAKYLKVNTVVLPSRTYPSVPCSIIHAGGKVVFEDFEWRQFGFYKLSPYPIFDAAHFFEVDMYKSLSHGENAFVCISFSATKPINIGKGGMILTDDVNAVEWFRKARFCGRQEKPLMEDQFDVLGWNMYMTPEQAARGLLLMNHRTNEKMGRLAWPEYPDLSKFEVYKQFIPNSLDLHQLK